MRTAIIALLAASLVPVLAPGQTLELKLDSLAAKAKEKAEIDLDGTMLEAGQKLAQGKIPAEMKQLLAGVKELHIRHYAFAKPGEYADQDLDPIRKQVGAGSGWSRIINVKEKNSNVEIYVQAQESSPGGVVVLVGEARELTVVAVVGKISLDKLTELVKSSVKYDLKSLQASTTP
jgi:hypothetical protein